jgi:hypothetical protein
MPDQERRAEEHGGAHDRDQAELRDQAGGVVEPWSPQVLGDLEGA